ncbi:MAG TPA: RnfH family protein [Burkholderiaceae bacterium]|nr:RnfH family protein [Burkholderiaceae bacterium]
MESAEIAVQVVWIPSERETLSVELTLAAGSTLASALHATGWPGLASAAQGDAAFAAAGLSAAVWSKGRALAHPLRDGDRVEVLRDLQIDPMTARRVRYEAAGGIDALRQRGYAGRKR